MTDAAALVDAEGIKEGVGSRDCVCDGESTEAGVGSGVDVP